MARQEKYFSEQGGLLDRCLAAFVSAGTLDLSLDQLAAQVGVSKRMLVHYFGRREVIEHEAMSRLEDRLRSQFSPEMFPAAVTAETVVMVLWSRTTTAESRGVLLLVMDVSRRAWNGSERARAFIDEQQRLWRELLERFIPERGAAEQVLQLFQGAMLAYLVTGDAEPGRQSLLRLLRAE